ncbi:MAG: alginate export family protein [Thermodesulfobacteriota bacterium]
MKGLQLLNVAIFLFISMICIQSSIAEEKSDYLSKHVSGGVNIKFRNELWNTFQKEDSDTDRTYDFFLVRARAYIDFNWEHVSFHVMGQGIKAFNLPENGAFGAGVSYFNASDEKSNPGNFQIVEAYIHLKNLRGFYFKGGRMGFKDGGQVLYKDSPTLNWIIQKRLSERLIGNWDWTLVGRRFDGGSGGYSNDIFDINLMGANVTFGGFDIPDGLWKDLDTVALFGGAFTLKKGVLLENTQFQIFNYFYFDNRTPAITLAGDDLKINTTGVSMAGAYPLSSGVLDTMLWFAFQLGDFGTLDQKALAFIAELGYQFSSTPWSPWLRFGVAYASGDGDPNDSTYGTFFNLVPTNHKWYGYADTTAFSNIIDVYNQILLTPHKKVFIGLEGHLFWLASDDEVWIGGAGPFNDSAFGYAFRNPAPGNDIESFLGGEVDLVVSFKALEYLILEAGYSHFFGAGGVQAVFDGKDQLDWFYTQATIPFKLGK